MLTILCDTLMMSTQIGYCMDIIIVTVFISVIILQWKWDQSYNRKKRERNRAYRGQNLPWLSQERSSWPTAWTPQPDLKWRHWMWWKTRYKQSLCSWSWPSCQKDDRWWWEMEQGPPTKYLNVLSCRLNLFIDVIGLCDSTIIGAVLDSWSKNHPNLIN